MAYFRTHDSILVGVIIAGLWLLKLLEFMYKHSRSHPSDPARFGYVVSLDVPIFVTIGLALMLAVRAFSRWYEGR